MSHEWNRITAWDGPLKNNDKSMLTKISGLNELNSQPTVNFKGLSLAKNGEHFLNTYIQCIYDFMKINDVKTPINRNV